ncbi:MAG: hypothetical protein MZV70_05965 [Desulfobacterales bacterium]|nr:hypothetical protein [Desulfobacterales bacterium]
MIPDSSPVPSRRRVRKSSGPFAVLALRAVLVLFPFDSPEIHAQGTDGLRAELAAQVTLQDFPARLAAAADRAAGASELLALYSEFIPKVSDGPARRSLLIRWAALLELSGRWEEAAARYEEAAFAAPGQRDTASLLSAARAWLAAGETEKARSILKNSWGGVPGRGGPRPGPGAGRVGPADRRLPAEARALAAQTSAAPPDREILLSALTLLWAASEGAPGLKRPPASGGSTPVPGGRHGGNRGGPGLGALAADAGFRRRPSFRCPRARKPAVPPRSTGRLPARPAASTPDASAARPSPRLPPVRRRRGRRRQDRFGPGRGVPGREAFSEESNASALVRELAGKGIKASPERRERERAAPVGGAGARRGGFPGDAPAPQGRGLRGVSCFLAGC